MGDKIKLSKEKQNAAMLSIGSNILLILSKLVVGLFTNSISIISEAVHSFTDLLAAIIAFFSVKQSSNPPDSDHQFGHGKYEDFSGFIEGALILAAAGYIIFEAIEKIINNKYDHIDTTAGIVVMLISVIANIIVSQNLFNVARKTDSMALLADAEHLRTDVLTSVGVLIGLVLIKVTNIDLLDPVVAILVALIIIKAGLDLCFKSGENLLDGSLPQEEQKIILDTVNNYIPSEIIEIKELKSRKSGADKLIELIIVIPKKSTIEAGHALCDRIEEDLKNNIKNARITIHIEPCCCTCDNCKVGQACKYVLDL
jgi:cation diffusion facilitator family transporter